jgi:hypothetical protein
MYGEQGCNWGCVLGRAYNVESLQGHCSHHLLIIAEEHRCIPPYALKTLSGYGLGGKIIYT